MYIEREALLANLKRQYGEDLGWQCTVNMSDVGMMIEYAPAADVVEVVRCKHCEHAVWDEEEQLWKCVISADWNEDIGEYVGFVEYHDADDFCSYGERRTNDV